jgi:multidrug efflux pump subunit AcrA (membrane-fusion protein)
MNEKSRSFEVEASFTKQPKVLYPNLTVEANIILQTKENALTIPRNYLIDDEFVLLADNKKKKVKVGLKDFQKAEIVEGLNKEDKIYLPQ